MATPLTDGINALTAYANEVTGKSNQTLSDAVESLVAGYGGGSSLFTVEKIKTYTVEESWENDAKGNPVAIQNALEINISELTNCSESFLCIFKNNNATNANYRADFIQYAKDSSVNHYGSYSVRGNVSTARGASSTNMSLWASIGTIIDVYKVKINL